MRDLRTLQQRFVKTEVLNHMHSVFAGRAQLLALQLDSTLGLLEGDLYIAAFGVLRAALEQTLVDCLLFRGSRIIRLYKGVSDEAWRVWQEERAAGLEAYRYVQSWERNRKDEVRIVYAGLQSTDDSDQVLSIFYFLLDEYVPWLGRPGAQEWFGPGLLQVEDRASAARRNQQFYNVYLSWRALKDNLRVNDLVVEDDIQRIDAHYSFLSSFVHPVAHVTETVYGPGSQWPSYDHYSSELALLYINVLAAEELRNFLLMSDRPPQLGLERRSEVESHIADCLRSADHLWYAGQHPHEYDRVSTANAVALASYRAGTPLTPRNPDDLSDEDILYYRNPLKRLVDLHISTREAVTGLSYQSPWERPDAWHRAQSAGPS
jgi:hypothetical protein